MSLYDFTTFQEGSGPPVFLLSLCDPYLTSAQPSREEVKLISLWYRRKEVDHLRRSRSMFAQKGYGPKSQWVNVAPTPRVSSSPHEGRQQDRV